MLKRLSQIDQKCQSTMHRLALILAFSSLSMMPAAMFSVMKNLQGACGLEANSVVKVLTMDQVQRDEEDNRNTTFYKAALADQVKDFQGGEYALFFENCVKLTMVTFELRVSLYNVDSSGNKDYLPVGEDVLPLLYMVRLRASILLDALLEVCTSAPHSK